MKINKIGILIAIAAITIALFVLPWYGLEKVGLFLGPFLYFGFLITIGYIIIDGISKFSNRLIDALGKRQAVGNEEINTKIELMMQRMQVIEDKVDKINTILEKVSD
ncbi:MAG: super-infection exclusion protein B [Candidatus Methanoperedens sp.]|nr:super-infection exclusion protein B [Candidatus Methanoperedens sp.]